MVVFGTQVCGDLSAGGAREWLVPDGVGGYAMGTVCGLRTRRYHGLLMVAEPGRPARRRLALAALDPVLTLPSGARVSLGVHEWSGGVIGPEGHLLLEHFELVDGLPRWRWRIGEVVIERELAMVYGAPQLGVVHRLVHAPGPVTLTVKALVTWRDAHGERGAGGPQPVLTPAAGGAIVEDAYRLRGPGWRPAGEWYRGVYAREEAARGLNPLEDLWFAGDFTAVLAPGGALEVEAWAGEAEPAPASVVVAEASERNRALVAGSRDETDAVLVRAADAFIVRGPDVVAGYPWFGTWSRDTMIAYEGLFLATGRAEEGRRLLHAYAATLSRGMLANTADTGQTDYNTVDATLWFMHAVERHVARTQDEDLADELLPALQSVVAEHVAGTRFNIVVDPADALLRQGAPGTALTWMDARVDGVPVTWRSGKPVEVNALWVNGLAGVAALQRRLGRDDSERRVRGPLPRPARLAVRRGRLPGGRRRVTAAQPVPGLLAAVRAAAGQSTAGGDRRGTAHPARATDARPRCARLPGPAPRRPGRPRSRLPPGHRLAVADRPVRGRDRSPRRTARRHRGTPVRVGRRLGERDRGGGPTAPRHRLPVSGLVRGRDAASAAR